MEVITLGSRNTDEIGRVSPIIIPVDSLPIPGISILNNPLIIREFGERTETTSLWIRDANNAYIRPGTNSDRVNIGGTSFIGSEKLRVVGLVQATGYFITPSISIQNVNGELSFSDTVSSATLTELLSNASSIPAANVTVEDVADVYVSDNVEDALLEIYGLITTSVHSHANKDLLDTYTNSDADITDAIAAIHDEVTIGAANGLSLDVQELSLDLASTDTTGALSDTDWNIFNNKIDSTNTIDAVKDLTLTNGGLIVGVDFETAAILPIGTASQVLTITDDGLSLNWEDPSGTGSGIFEVPVGFTSISNEIGDVNNTEYNPVTDLNGVTLLKVLQDMLFPAPDYPNFVNPTATITVTPTGSTPATMFNSTFVENGGTSTIGTTSILSSGNGPGGKPYAISNGSPSFTKNAVAYTTGASVTFTANTTFAVTYPYKPNGTGEVDPESVTLSNGTTVFAESYIGANSGNATNSRVYTVVDPIYYGNMTGSIGSYPTLPTDAELVVGTTKLVSSEPTSALTINVASYNTPSAVDNTKYIVIYYPDSYGVLSDIRYVQNSNQSIKNIFTTNTVTHTRPDSNTVTYRVYYTSNPYNNSEVVTYTIHF